jgi:hypothetical protein
MTVAEMHVAFRLHLNKSTSLVGTPDFLPEEIDFWLNEAQDRFIKQRLFGNNYRKEGFEDSPKRIEDLRNLIVFSIATYISSSYLGVNVKESALSAFTDFNYLIRFVLRDVNGNKVNGSEVIKHSDLYKYIQDSINYPFIKRPLAIIDNSTLYIVHDPDYSPVAIDIEYIRHPLKLTSFTPITNVSTDTCELTTTTHSEMVVIAAELAIENIESPRVQTFTSLNSSKIE